MLPETMPVCPVRGSVIYPTMVMPIDAGRPISIRAIDEALARDRVLLIVSQRDKEVETPRPSDLFEVGTACNILKMRKNPDGSVQVLVQAFARVRVREWLDLGDHLEARGEVLADEPGEPILVKALVREVKDKFQALLKEGKYLAPEVAQFILNLEDPSQLADYVAFHMDFRLEDKQKVLETANVAERLRAVLVLLEAELALIETQRRIQQQVKEEIDRNQREYFLREQMKAIQRELHGEEGEQEVEEFRRKLEALDLPPVVRQEAERELNRFARMHPDSAEASVIRTYLDWIVNLPWNTRTEDNLDLERAKEILERDHYGLEKVKDRIIEYLAVQARTNKLKGPILCLVGPPGVGKTSLGKSIAKATGREFIRQSLGGVRDEAEIRGHRRTYIGSMPGKVAANLKKAGTMNPLFLLDEIDKLGQDFRGDPASALLEVLDPEQNNKFNDHYLEIDLDLSDVMFVTTANSLNLPQALLDRMEIIRLEGYTEDEKLEIAKRHLIEKQIEAHGLKKDEFSISDDAMRDVIRYYTREAGVRTLEREIAKLARKALRRILEGKDTSIAITPENLADFSGVRKYRHDMGEEENQIGAVTGLAWTEVGGELLTIEAVTVPGKGQIKTTGKLGEVMSESIQAALSYVKARAPSYGIKPSLFARKDVHIHLPEGAVPKDGPSAGIGMVTCIVSTLTGIAVHRDVAMTGEVTLRGRVLPIGGLKEKLLAALRGGIKTVLIPQENEKDLADIPANIKNGLEIIPVSHVDQVLARALVAPLVAVEWTEADDLAAALPAGIGGENGASVTH